MSQLKNHRSTFFKTIQSAFGDPLLEVLLEPHQDVPPM